MTPGNSNSALRERSSDARFVAVPFREIRASTGDDGQMRFVGYGAYFGNVDSYGDSIAKGAFKRTLKEAKKSGRWPVMLAQHGGWGITAQDLTPVGVWAELDEDDNGLLSTGVLADTPRGGEFYKLLKMSPRPAIDGLSIGYIPKAWKTNSSAKEGEPRRTLTDVDLMEISLVTFPANDRARVSSVKTCGSAREFESAFRQVFGLSSREAKRAASAVWQALGKGDDNPSSEVRDLLKKTADRFATITR